MGDIIASCTAPGHIAPHTVCRLSVSGGRAPSALSGCRRLCRLMPPAASRSGVACVTPPGDWHVLSAAAVLLASLRYDITESPSPERLRRPGLRARWSCFDLRVHMPRGCVGSAWPHSASIAWKVVASGGGGAPVACRVVAQSCRFASGAWWPLSASSFAHTAHQDTGHTPEASINHRVAKQCVWTSSWPGARTMHTHRSPTPKGQGTSGPQPNGASLSVVPGTAVQRAPRIAEVRANKCVRPSWECVLHGGAGDAWWPRVASILSHTAHLATNHCVTKLCVWASLWQGARTMHLGIVGHARRPLGHPAGPRGGKARGRREVAGQPGSLQGLARAAP